MDDFISRRKREKKKVERTWQNFNKEGETLLVIFESFTRVNEQEKILLCVFFFVCHEECCVSFRGIARYFLVKKAVKKHQAREMTHSLIFFKVTAHTE
jgi:hypothetical protein